MSELVEKLKENAEVLGQPIPGDAPGGTDISYEPEFDVVRGEIDKLTVMAGEVPNWGQIVSSGEQLLKEKSKDMRLVTWVAAARMKRDGLEGLAAGLAGISAVCRNQWTTMFPPLKRAKARGNLAGWLGEMILADYSEYTPTAKDKAALGAVEVFYNELDEVLSEKLADGYEGMGPIRTLLRDKTRMLPADAPVAAPVPAAPAAAATPPITPAAAAPIATPAPAAPPAAMAVPSLPSVTNVADVGRALVTLGNGIFDVARHLRKANPADPMSYRLARTGTWLDVDEAPHADGGKTRIPPPDRNDTNRLQGLFERQEWPELLSTAEGMINRFVFWLDLHRFVALASERQGASFVAVHQVVVSQVTTFIEQFPDIVDLTFSDGTPFADEATKGWIEEELAKRGGGGAGNSTAHSQLDDEAEELKVRFQAAREMVLGGKIGEGLTLAVQLARRSSDARSSFRARLETAQLALKASRPELARPLLDGLVREAEVHGLEHWEPALCSELYAALLKARQGAGGSSEEVPSDEVIFSRLCRLDPAAAMKVVK